MKEVVLLEMLLEDRVCLKSVMLPLMQNQLIPIKGIRKLEKNEKEPVGKGVSINMFIIQL